MPQMVLPQTSVPGSPKDAGTTKTGAGRDRDNGESRFESVSRAEQQRLDDRRADEKRADAKGRAQAAEKSAAADRERSADRSNPEQPANETATAKTDAAESAKGAKVVEAEQGETQALTGVMETAEADAADVPLTFAGLQALLVPAKPQGESAGADAMGKGAGVVLGQFAQLSGAASTALNGKPGQPGQGTPGLTTGLQLTEALTASLASETSRPVDQTSLAAASRFQSSFEMAAQQAASANKLPAEAAVPLKGYATSIDLPVSHGEWGDKVVGKLSWLTARNMSVAEIHLTPPDMGPMEVKVRVQNDQANITVHAANPVVRDQLELHSHRLRDMLGEQGLSLSQFDVSDQPQRQTGEQGAGDGSGERSGASADELALSEADDGEIRAGTLDLSWKGEIDLFA